MYICIYVYVCIRNHMTVTISYIQQSWPRGDRADDMLSSSSSSSSSNNSTININNLV